MYTVIKIGEISAEQCPLIVENACEQRMFTSMDKMDLTWLAVWKKSPFYENV